jgi:hypothetical protein
LIDTTARPDPKVKSSMPTSRTIAMRLCVAVSACLLFTAAAAPAEKPAVSIKTKAIEATVTVDNALDAYPGLVPGLVAEGRREVETTRREAEKLRREDPKFNDGRPWTFERAYSQRSAIGRYVSIVRTDETYQGGAHGNQQIDTILWDRDAKKRISIRSFFKESADKGSTMTAMAKLVRAAVFDEKKRRKLETVEGTPDTNEWLKEIKPSLLSLGPVTLAPSTEAGKSAGLTFHFSPYMVGPYAEGPLTAFVPWTEFKDRLSPPGAALFGGARPDGDVKEVE